MKNKALSKKYYVTKSRLASFLYQLMRDVVPFGKLETIIHGDKNGDEWELEDKSLGLYAKNMADRLTRKRKKHGRKDG